MASARIVYSPSSLIGQKFARVAALGAQFRQAVLETHNEIEAYNDNNAQLEADAGMASGGGSNIRGQYNLAAAELTGTCINQINAGAQTATRILIDQTA